MPKQAITVDLTPAAYELACVGYLEISDELRRLRAGEISESAYDAETMEQMLAALKYAIAAFRARHMN